MELRQYLSVVYRWLWLVILSVLIAASSSFLASRAATPLYRTKTTLMVGNVTDPTTTSSELYTGQQLAYTYIQLAQREPVLKGALDSLGVDMPWQALAGQVSAYVVPQTQLIEISVIDNDPYRAKVFADAVANQVILISPAGLSKSDEEDTSFIQAQVEDLKVKIKDAQGETTRKKQELDAANSARLIQDLESQINILETKISGWQDTLSKYLLLLEGGDVNVLSVVEEAQIPTQPISPNVRMNVLLASVIGLVLAVGGIFLIEYLDDTVKTTDDIVRLTDLPALGHIGYIAGDDYPEKLIAVRYPLSPTVEDYRSLWMNLQFSSLDAPAHTLLITSPNPEEGKSVTLANLAVVIAKAGRRVIAVDTDLRRPTLHKIFGLPNHCGLSDLLLSPEIDLKNKLLETEIPNLYLLTSGPLPPSPAEVLTSMRIDVLIDELKGRADMILFDSPPALLVADAAILGTRMDGVVMINRAGSTRSADARKAVSALQAVRIHVLGTVLNRQKNGRAGGYKYYQYYQTEEGKTRRKRRSFWDLRHTRFAGKTERTLGD